MSRARSNALRPAARWKMSSIPRGGIKASTAPSRSRPAFAGESQMVATNYVDRRKTVTWVAFGPGNALDTTKAEASADRAPRRGSRPAPRRTGETAKWSSSSSPACRYCLTTETPPPMRTSLPPASFCRPLQRRLDAIGHEVKDGAALHLDGRARMMRQDKHRHVVGRVVSPPALPGMVRPLAAYRAEHVSPHDPCADVFHRAFGRSDRQMSAHSPFLADHS